MYCFEYQQINLFRKQDFFSNKSVLKGFNQDQKLLNNPNLKIKILTNFCHTKVKLFALHFLRCKSVFAGYGSRDWGDV